MTLRGPNRRLAAPSGSGWLLEEADNAPAGPPHHLSVLHSQSRGGIARGPGRGSLWLGQGVRGRVGSSPAPPALREGDSELLD